MNHFIKFLILSLGYSSYAQMTLPTSHLPKIGDTAHYYVDTNIYSPKPLSNGVFDFSDLKKHDSTIVAYLVNDNTLDYPGANLKFIIDFIETSSNFFKTTSNDLILMGSGAIGSQLGAFGNPQLNGTLKYMSYPFNSSSNISSSDKISITLPGSIIPPQLNIDSIIKATGFGFADSVKIDSIVIEVNIKLDIKAQGSGKIKTPIDNNIDVIKIERTITPDLKLYLYGKAYTLLGVLPINKLDLTTLLMGQIPIPIESVKTHSYHSPNFKAEILTATIDTNGKYQTVQYRKKSSTSSGTQTSILNAEFENVSIANTASGFKINQLNEFSKYKAFIYNTQGTLIMAWLLNAESSHFQLNDYPAGIYFIQLISDKNQTINLRLAK